ncbi:hypothetical protein JVT61DRAFT_3672 [Boletus reticuloceps]|uniref:Uncharacterized protein n=1 Tax=Boletus reticuloceps TaxID=495285 RepID=A0A8I2YNV8_9AGAM|nr:hypothetical protein JVT61DRAFT_3672 [Boletus reticuloceps]
MRKCPPQFKLMFSKELMMLQFGNLGQHCQWIEGTLYVANQDDTEEPILTHMTMTLEELIDQVEDTTVCGNFLDGKDMTPSPPLWAVPLFQSTTAWNNTMHLQFSQKAKKRRELYVEIDEGGPKAIRAATWTSQGWRLLTHTGYITFPHHNCCRMCTYVVGNAGAKLWAILQLKQKDDCPTLLRDLIEAFQRATTPSEDGKYTNANIATVCLEEGDVMYVALISFFFFVLIPAPPGFKPWWYYTVCTLQCHQISVVVISTTTKRYT